MISNIIWLLNLVRTKILEKFTLPELQISYWDFLLYLCLAAIVITVLINSVRVSGSGAVKSSKSNAKKSNSK